VALSLTAQRHCAPVRLPGGGRSLQFGRTSAPITPHLVQTALPSWPHQRVFSGGDLNLGGELSATTAKAALPWTKDIQSIPWPTRLSWLPPPTKIKYPAG
jgi:hypothetical protein